MTISRKAGLAEKRVLGKNQILKMKRKQFKEEQIVRILKEAEEGMQSRICYASMGLAKEPTTAGRANTVGWRSNDLAKLKELEEQNRRLKRLVAEQALDIQILKDINSKNW